MGLETRLAFHLAGHAPHQVRWKNLSPNGGDKPTGEPAAAIDEHIDEHFGSFDELRAQPGAAANTIQGSGRGVLAREPVGQRLITRQLKDHHSNPSIATTPPLVSAIREHAYYLQYRNLKADYVNALRNVVNRDDVAARFEAVRAGQNGPRLPRRPHGPGGGCSDKAPPPHRRGPAPGGTTGCGASSVPELTAAPTTKRRDLG